MENQALLSSKDKSRKLKCRLLQFLFGALRVHSFLAPINFMYLHYNKAIYHGDHPSNGLAVE